MKNHWHITLDETGGFVFMGHCDDKIEDDHFHFLGDRESFHNLIDAIFDKTACNEVFLKEATE
jgi:hypothetical protein